jgi:hypothetical protein
MFKELGQMMGLLKQAPKIKEEMERLQQRLPTLNAEGDAGAGMVRVRVNGRMELISVSLTDEAVKGGDRELLEDLIRAAVNQALDKARKLVSEETAKVASGFGLPNMEELSGLIGGS